MFLDEFLPHAFLEGQFYGLRAYTVVRKTSRLEITIEFSSENNLKVNVVTIESGPLEWRYKFCFSNDIVHFITRLCFNVARCIHNLNGVMIQGAISSVVYEQLRATENIEMLLNRIPNDTELDDERIYIFLAILRSAWDNILLHEFAHITLGHLRFKAENQEEFSQNPALARSCEFEADDRVATWITQKLIINPPEWLTSNDAQHGVGTSLAKFHALIAAILYLSFALQNEDSSLGLKSAHPNTDFRQFFFVSAILGGVNWIDQRAKLEAAFFALTEASRLLNLILGQSEFRKPSIVFNRTLDELKSEFSRLIGEHSTHSARWRDLNIP